MNKRIRKWASRDLLYISILIFVVFFFTSSLKPQGIFWSLDEGGKFLYLQSVLKSGSVQAPLIYPGKYLDTNYSNIALYFYILKNGNIYSWWPVGFPLLTLPLYRYLGWMGLYLIPALSGAIIAYISGLIVRKVLYQSRWAGIVTVLIIGLASPISFYSMTFWEHNLAVAFAMLSLYLLVINFESTKSGGFLIAGVLGSIATFFRTEVGLVLIGFGFVLIMLKWQKAIIFGLAGIITTGLWMTANQYLMGYPISPNFNSVSSSINGLISTGVKFIPYLLFNTPTISAFSLGRLLLIIGSLSVALFILLGLFPRTRLWSLIPLSVILFICIYVLVQGSLYRSVHGFVLICPLILLSIWGYQSPPWKQYRPFWLICLGGITIFMLTFIAKAWIAAGGLQWGPRYMLALYPLLIIASIPGIWSLENQIKKISKWITTGLIVVAILVGFGFQVRGYITMVLTMHLYNESSETLRTYKNSIITTDCTWMPMVIPDLYWNGNIFRETPGETFLSNLEKAGITSYLSVNMVSCSTTYLDQVIQEYKLFPSGLIITQHTLETP